MSIPHAIWSWIAVNEPIKIPENKGIRVLLEVLPKADIILTRVKVINILSQFYSKRLQVHPGLGV